jgi:hypothetical protein
LERLAKLKAQSLPGPQVLTALVALQRIRVRTQTFRSWVTRGKLAEIGRTDEDEPIYSVDEALKLALRIPVKDVIRVHDDDDGSTEIIPCEMSQEQWQALIGRITA